MSRIKVYGNKAIVLDEINYSFLQALDLELSYKLVGIEHTLAYKRGWDGRTRLLKNNLEFPAGLVQRVVELYDRAGIEVEVFDSNKYKDNRPFDISKRLKEMDKSPRDYQIFTANKALECKKGIVKICTGGGKTLVAAQLVAEIGGNAVIYVIGKDLLWQFKNFFEDVFQKDIGVIGDGVCDIQPITIASVWSVGQAFGMKKRNSFDDERNIEKRINEKKFKDIKEYISTTDISIMDECHLGAAETIQRISTSIKSKYIIGMSASPSRDDGADLLIEAIFGKIIVNISASELIEKGFLVKPYIRFLPVPKMTGIGNTYKQKYKNFIVNNKIRNNFIVKGGIKMVEEGFITMVLYKEIEHGSILYEMFQEKNVSCRILNGKMSSKQRKEGVDDLLNDKCKLLLASSIFDIGIDIPSLSGLILAGAGCSKIRAIQRLGRCIRASKNKTMAAILDFNDNCKYLNKHSRRRYEIYKQEKGFEVSWKGRIP